MGNKEELRKQQQMLMDTLNSMQKLNLSILSPKLSHGEFRTMKCIVKCNKHREAKVSDIVKMMEAPPPAVSRTLRNLESKGYILRKTDKEDRRNTIVIATPEGKEVLKESNDIMCDFADTVFENMGEDSLTRLNRIMEQMLNTAEKELEKRKNAKLEGREANE